MSINFKEVYGDRILEINRQIRIAVKNKKWTEVAKLKSEKAGPTNKFNSAVENVLTNKEGRIPYLKREKRRKEIQFEKVNNILSILTEKERIIIELRYFKRSQFQDIADIVERNDIYLISLRKKIIEDKLVPPIKR